MEVLAVGAALMVLWVLKRPGAAQGEQEGPRGLSSVTLKVPFSKVFMIPKLNCTHTNRTEMIDDQGSKITAMHVCVKYVDILYCTHSRREQVLEQIYK